MKKQPFTIKVRRGLGFIHECAKREFDRIAAENPTQIGADEKQDVTAALRWIEENKDPE